MFSFGTIAYDSSSIIDFALSSNGGSATFESETHLGNPAQINAVSNINDGDDGTYHGWGSIMYSPGVPSVIQFYDYVTFSTSSTIVQVDIVWKAGYQTQEGNVYLYYDSTWNSIGSLSTSPLNTVITNTFTGSWSGVTGVRTRIRGSTGGGFEGSACFAYLYSIKAFGNG